jgi:hypothetical protein
MAPGPVGLPSKGSRHGVFGIPAEATREDFALTSWIGICGGRKALDFDPHGAFAQRRHNVDPVLLGGYVMTLIGVLRDPCVRAFSTSETLRT